MRLVSERILKVDDANCKFANDYTDQQIKEAVSLLKKSKHFILITDDEQGNICLRSSISLYKYNTFEKVLEKFLSELKKDFS